MILVSLKIFYRAKEFYLSFKYMGLETVIWRLNYTKNNVVPENFPILKKKVLNILNIWT